MSGQPRRIFHETDPGFWTDLTDFAQHQSDAQDLVDLHPESGSGQAVACMKIKWRPASFKSSSVNGQGEAPDSVVLSWSRKIQFVSTGEQTQGCFADFSRESKVTYMFAKHLAKRVAIDCAKYTAPPPSDQFVMDTVAQGWLGNGLHKLIEWEKTADRVDTSSMEGWDEDQRTFDLKQQNPNATYSVMTFVLSD